MHGVAKALSFFTKSPTLKSRFTRFSLTLSLDIALSHSIGRHTFALHITLLSITSSFPPSLHQATPQHPSRIPARAPFVGVHGGLTFRLL